ncbi:MAG TPA: NADH-quinone oxidoreductase subunit J [Mycobacteriales bacterium]|jgi:NADH-quinone oxidoreductase subunit J|nr:NADH-quinone oxidoreductase subunit J [Mycobacteriales bacterium]
MIHAVALAAAAGQHIPAGQQMRNGEAVMFWLLGPLSIIGALGMVLSRNAVHSALWLVTTMFSLGIFYIMEQGPFIGFVQIIVYTGAIMILFLFVLMLIGRDTSDSLIETLRGQRLAAILLGTGMAAMLVGVLAGALDKRRSAGLEAANASGNLPGISKLLFHDYVFAFELTSALLITAAVGAMVLGNIEREPNERRTQKQISKARFRSGEYVGPKPGPGVYAYGDGVSRRALLPDGTTAESSVIKTAEVAELEQHAPSRGELERSEQ